MNAQIILKHTETLDKYPYARYVYMCITAYFQSIGGEVIELTSAQFKPPAGAGPVLWVVDLPVSSGFTRKWSQMVQLPRLLKKVNADLVISLGWNLPALPKMKAGKWLVIPELEGFHVEDKPDKKELIRRSSLISRVSQVEKAFLFTPAAMATTREILTQGKGEDSAQAVDTKLHTWIPFAQNKLGALDFEKKESIKELYTDGHEYFFMDAASANQARVIQYLKAFSHFKKWQNSSMKLVLLLSEGQLSHKGFQDLFNSYHFREDVVLKAAKDSGIRYDLMAAAYAVIEPSGQPGHLVTLLEAAQYGTLAVGMAIPGTTEILGEALFALPGTSFQEIGQTMITIYKSEILRSRHIKAAAQMTPKFQPKDWAYWLNDSKYA